MRLLAGITLTQALFVNGVHRVIHQQYSTSDESARPAAWAVFSETLRDQHEGWEWRFWTDEDQPLLFSDVSASAAALPELLSCSSMGHIMRAQLAAMAMLYSHGGLYVDMGRTAIRPIDRRLEKLERQRAGVMLMGWQADRNVVGKDISGAVVDTGVMYSPEAKHPFWRDCIASAVAFIQEHRPAVCSVGQQWGGVDEAVMRLATSSWRLRVCLLSLEAGGGVDLEKARALAEQLLGVVAAAGREAAPSVDALVLGALRALEEPREENLTEYDRFFGYGGGVWVWHHVQQDLRTANCDDSLRNATRRCVSGGLHRLMKKHANPSSRTFFVDIARQSYLDAISWSSVLPRWISSPMDEL